MEVAVSRAGAWSLVEFGEGLGGKIREQTSFEHDPVGDILQDRAVMSRYLHSLDCSFPGWDNTDSTPWRVFCPAPSIEKRGGRVFDPEKQARNEYTLVVHSY